MSSFDTSRLSPALASVFESVVVHELCHLLEPSHNARFHALMAHYFLDWRQARRLMGSHGSSSMGSVCASTLSLLQAGVPLRAPVAGIAMDL